MGGQGQRPNAQGLDLNRDHMKLDSPEGDAVVKLMNDYDPHVSMDLHTTNGTRHAYYLTYAPPLNPATDAGDHRAAAQGLAAVGDQDDQDKYDWDYYYYGNSKAAAAGAAGEPAPERAWRSFDSRPALQQQLHRPAQPHRRPERGVRLRHVQGPHRSRPPGSSRRT